VAKAWKIEPGEPEPGLPEALRLLPQRLVDLGIAREISREKIAELVDRHPSQIGRWLAYKGLESLAASVLIKLEDGFGLAPGTLLSPYSIDLVTDAKVLDTSAIGEAMGVTPSVLEALLSGAGAGMMSGFGVGLRRAILAATHLFGFPLETVLKAAQEAKAKVGAAELEPESWLGEMRPFLKDKKAESGTHPSYGKVKIG